MNYCIIDIETRSFADLKSVGAWKYAEHPKTDILCLAYKTADMPEPGLWILGDAFPEILKDENLKIVAHSAQFEYALFSEVGVKRYGWPSEILDFNRWECTANYSRVCGLPGSLMEASAAMKLPERKDIAGKKLIDLISVPVVKKGEMFFREVYPEEMEAFYMYCKQDVKTTELLYLKLKYTNNVLLEKEVMRLDLMQNVHGLPVDAEMLEILNIFINDRITFAEHMSGDFFNIQVTSNKQLLECLRDRFGIKADNVQELTLTRIKKAHPENEDLHKLIDLRLFLTRAAVKKVKALKELVSPDNFVRYNLMYHGAGPGRWTGKGFQIHNLPKTGTNINEIESLYDKIKNNDIDFFESMDAVKKLIPALIKAEPGKCFIMGDFAAIEARVLCFLAGQQDLLQDFIDGVDIYKKMAADIYGIPVDFINKNQRQLGKQVILLSGYGGGWKKLHETVTEKYELDILEKVAKIANETYRKKYYKIVAFWYRIQEAFEKAYKQKTKIDLKEYYLSIEGAANTVKIMLPSGRYLYYHGVSISEDEGLTYKNQKGRSKLYGGLLVENICQAVARDILVDRMMKCQKWDLNPIMSVHDEIVCYVDIVEAEKKLNEFTDIMNTAPVWLPGFPLETKTEISARYFK